MVKTKFTPEEFLKTQLDILKSFEKKLNTLFIESVASKKKNTRQVLLEFMGILRETTSWYVRINESMLLQNKKIEDGYKEKRAKSKTRLN